MILNLLNYKLFLLKTSRKICTLSSYTMKKKKRKNRLAILGSIFALSIIVLFISSYTANSPPKQITNYQTQFPVNDRWYHSPTLKFSILVPAEYTIEDTQITITLTKNNEEITIIRNGTNYQTLEEYLKNSDLKSDLKIEQEDKLEINGLKSIKRVEYFTKGPKDRHKIYFIFNNSAVYVISTSSDSLFSDLDTITHSFQYIP